MRLVPGWEVGRVGQRRLLAEQSEQRLLDEGAKLRRKLTVGNTVAHEIEILLELVVADDSGERFPLTPVGLEHVANAAAVRMRAW